MLLADVFILINASLVICHVLYCLVLIYSFECFSPLLQTT